MSDTEKPARYRDDPALVLRAKVDVAAATELYGRYAAAIDAWARDFGHLDPEEARAIAGLAFARAVAHFDASRGTFVSLLRTLVRGELGDALRGEVIAHGHEVREGRTQPLADRLVAGEEADPAPDPSEALQYSELRDAVSALPARYRAVIELRFFEGLTFEAIADRLGLASKQLACKHASLGLELLRKQVR